jgi:hypothetical protein
MRRMTPKRAQIQSSFLFSLDFIVNATKIGPKNLVIRHLSSGRCRCVRTALQLQRTITRIKGRGRRGVSEGEKS